MNSREIVNRTVRFQHPDRVPRDLWLLPWAEWHFPREIAELRQRYPPDIVTAPSVYHQSPRVKGDPYELGEYTDEWGCTFENIQAGAIGEVRVPLLKEITHASSVLPPYEILPRDLNTARSAVNKFCAETEKFVLSEACPRPWERYQFLRGSAAALMDMAAIEAEVVELLRVIHRYYLEELEFWVSTDVDAVHFMDDWGGQRNLLISPHIWREVFRPLYKDYCDIAHANGKSIFMHSDGNIEEIFPDLVEIGVDAVNSQLFCMDLDKVSKAVKGKITFWGEIDRQHVLSSSDPESGRVAVRQVVQHLYDPAGGVIAQLEFGLAANPEVVMAVYEEWGLVSGSKAKS